MTLDNGTYRFKIDLFDASSWPFALYVRRRNWLGITRWEYLTIFETKEQAVAHYERIKSLPEYLE